MDILLTKIQSKTHCNKHEIRFKIGYKSFFFIKGPISFGGRTCVGADEPVFMAPGSCTGYRKPRGINLLGLLPTFGMRNADFLVPFPTHSTL